MNNQGPSRHSHGGGQNRSHPYSKSRENHGTDDHRIHDQTFKYCPDKALKYKGGISPEFSRPRNPWAFSRHGENWTRDLWRSVEGEMCSDKSGRCAEKSINGK